MFKCSKLLLFFQKKSCEHGEKHKKTAKKYAISTEVE